jgi:hypothetical protein
MKKDHWTQDDYAAMHASETLRHLANVGIRMVQELQDHSPDGSVTILSGPMTTGGVGSFEGNIHLFEHAIDVVREHGYIVFNQLPFQHGLIRILNLHKDKVFFEPGGDPKTYPQQILDGFYWPLFEARGLDHLLLLPTWVTSNGSTQELTKAFDIGGIKIEEIHDDWYQEALRRAKPFINNLKGGA